MRETLVTIVAGMLVLAAFPAAALMWVIEAVAGVGFINEVLSRGDVFLDD